MEKVLIEWLRKKFGRTDFATVGIGDDCAVLPPTESSFVVTCDAVCDTVHFSSRELTAQEIGRKALAVNLSDLASMGATAQSALVTLVLPSSLGIDYAKDIFRGMMPLAESYGVEIVGGDTITGKTNLMVSITAIGIAPSSGSWLISEAQPGDQIVVTGEFGGSILGHHVTFEPRLNFAQQWRNEAGVIKACTDVSDSLGIDLAKIAKASGLGFQIDLTQVPISKAAYKIASTSGRTPLHHSLTDGEDFELVLAIAPENWERVRQATSDVRLTKIGQFTDDQKYRARIEERWEPFQPQGYEHTSNE